MWSSHVERSWSSSHLRQGRASSGDALSGSGTDDPEIYRSMIYDQRRPLLYLGWTRLDCYRCECEQRTARVADGGSRLGGSDKGRRGRQHVVDTAHQHRRHPSEGALRFQARRFLSHSLALSPNVLLYLTRWRSLFSRPCRWPSRGRSRRRYRSGAWACTAAGRRAESAA